MKRLAVYCGSASPADARYVALARDVGTQLAERGIGLPVCESRRWIEMA